MTPLDTIMKKCCPKCKCNCASDPQSCQKCDNPHCECHQAKPAEKEKKCPSCLAGFSKEDIAGNCTCDPTPELKDSWEEEFDKTFSKRIFSDRGGQDFIQCHEGILMFFREKEKAWEEAAREEERASLLSELKEKVEGISIHCGKADCGQGQCLNRGERRRMKKEILYLLSELDKLNP